MRHRVEIAARYPDLFIDFVRDLALATEHVEEGQNIALLKDSTLASSVTQIHRRLFPTLCAIAFTSVPGHRNVLQAFMRPPKTAAAAAASPVSGKQYVASLTALIKRLGVSEKDDIKTIDDAVDVVKFLNVLVGCSAKLEDRVLLRHTMEETGMKPAIARLESWADYKRMSPTLMKKSAASLVTSNPPKG